MKLEIFSRLIFLCLLLSQAVIADDEFIVKDIKVKGLQRISLGTVLNDFPVNVGESFSLNNSGAAIRALFKTGFFKDVSLERDESTLIINVVERPTIAKIVFEGNKDLSKDDLKKALDKIGLSEGKVFDRQVLDKVEQELSRQYLSHGKYGLRIKTEVSKLTRNRVAIKIKISEGRVTKIKSINIVGNNAFEDKELLGKFESKTSNLLSFYTKDDQYSKQKLSADLETLLSHYLDRGYINFSVESTQVAISPDKKDIYITVNVKEGDVYKLGKVKLAGNLVAPPGEIIKLVSVGPGETFSRKNATETQKAIQDRLGDEGYAFANVNMIPEINEAKKTVDVTFSVDPGKRVYVRNINVKGNKITRDEVVRREMRQMESSWASSSKIERSKVRLERLGYFESVNVETPQVAGTPDKIDVNYTVVEKPMGNLSAGVGYSQVQGVILNANVAQDNVFGSGKRVNLAFNNSSYATAYQFGFFNPYLTTDGVSLGHNIGFVKRNAGNINIANYNTDTFDIGLNFGIPMNETDQLRFDANVRHTYLKTTSYSSTQISDFIQQYNPAYPPNAPNTSAKFWTFMPGFMWAHDTLNRAIFPSKGGLQRLAGTISIPGSDLTYYKINYKHQNYFAISKDFTLRLLGEIAYGGSYGSTHGLPFFENYFGGGNGSIRGYKNNTVGPYDSNGYSLGGSTKFIANAEVFFPVPFMADTKSIRLGTFFDAGRIADNFNVNNIVYSAGLSGEWLSPFGALSVSVAQPFVAAKTGIGTIQNPLNGNQHQVFQFNFGQNF